MKQILFLLCFTFLLLGCDKDEEPETFTANATLLIDSSEVDNCRYSIQTSNNQYFAAEQIPQELQDGAVKVSIEFIKTNEYIDCGYAGSQPKIVIIDLQVIGATANLPKNTFKTQTFFSINP